MQSESRSINRSYAIAGILFLAVNTTFMGILMAYCRRRIDTRFKIECKRYEELFERASAPEVGEGEINNEE